MKIQNLAIIFLVIAIPLIMVLSYYLNLQQQTLRLQIEYDTKLAQATKEGIKAFESNTIDWSEYIKELADISERSTAMASVNTFLTSLENNLNLTGTAKEYMTNYIPAIAITLYNGYYVYSPNYVCTAIQNKNGIQLYYNEDTDKIEDEYTGDNKIIYEPLETVATKTRQYKYVDDFGREITENITFVTDREDAKKEYKPILNNKNTYTARYTKYNTNVIVNYTLDNKIYIYGIANNEQVATSAYLVYFDEDSQMPRLSSNKANPQKINDIMINETVTSTMYNGVRNKTRIIRRTNIIL